MSSFPRWTVTTNGATEPLTYEVEGLPELDDRWIIFMRRVSPDAKHMVAIFPLANLLSITSHNYVEEDQR